MIKPLWAVAGVAILGTAGLGGALLIASSGDEEEVLQQVQTASPSPYTTPAASPTATPVAVTPGPTAEATQVTGATPRPPQPTAPPDWPTYSDAGGLFTIRYPSTWFQTGEAQFSSYDITKSSTTQRAPEAITVEVNYYEAVGSSGCGGAMSVDPKSGQGSPEPGATETTLGGVPAWEMVRLPGDPAIEGPLTRIHGISTIYQGYCFVISAYFTQQNPEVAVFLQITSSFEFKSPAG